MTDFLPPQILHLGDEAPNFTARSTMGPITLSDYRGRWLLFFSHPADFTPVCTSEFIALAKAAPRFKALGCDLLALSIDSLYAHLAWVRAIQDGFGVTVPFPIIEDPSMVIGHGYAMLNPDAPDSGTLRHSLFIDPAGIIRASITYPASIGRSVEELLRALAALQHFDAHGEVTPADWQPGQNALNAAHEAQDSMLKDGGQDGGIWFHREAKA
jgi:peroxiredoxin (alkyl hydroperoxide reductase subunit C)